VHREKIKMEDKKMINGNRWVVHFDILGFRSMVKNFPVWYVRDECKKAIEKGKTSNIKCRFKFFSDSFIFYTDDDLIESFYCIEGTSALFFRAMFLGRIPMRGCLNVGQFYADEENGIFFGPAHINAHDLAESQQWIGYIFSEEAREKLAGFEVLGVKAGYKKRYVEYEVPFKGYRKCMLVYNLVLSSNNSGTQNELYTAFENMKITAVEVILNEGKNRNVDNGKQLKDEEIIGKYKNTEEFLLHVYPDLKDRMGRIKKLCVPVA
jgi:hypothetical protein